MNDPDNKGEEPADREFNEIEEDLALVELMQAYERLYPLLPAPVPEGEHSPDFDRTLLGGLYDAEDIAALRDYLHLEYTIRFVNGDIRITIRNEITDTVFSFVGNNAHPLFSSISPRARMILIKKARKERNGFVCLEPGKEQEIFRQLLWQWSQKPDTN